MESSECLIDALQSLPAHKLLVLAALHELPGGRQPWLVLGEIPADILAAWTHLSLLTAPLRPFAQILVVFCDGYIVLTAPAWIIRHADPELHISTSQITA